MLCVDLTADVCILYFFYLPFCVVSSSSLSWRAVGLGCEVCHRYNARIKAYFFSCLLPGVRVPKAGSSISDHGLTMGTSNTI